MHRSLSLVALAALAALAWPGDARAEIAYAVPSRVGGGAVATPALLVSPWGHPSPVPTGPPPIREVRAGLRAAQGAIQACAVQYQPPGTGRTRRLRARVWLYPTGRWTMEVPELDATPRGRPQASHAALRSCMRAAIAVQIQRHMRRFRGRARQKVERAFRVRMPGPPPSEAELARRVTRRRRQLVACVPGAGSQGEQATLTVRATLETSGGLTLTGLEVPEGVPFDTATACVTAALAPVRTDAVTAPRSFEATLRFRYTAPVPPVRPPPPPVGDPPEAVPTSIPEPEIL